ncbi:MAG: ATPase P [Chloroflexi bacterium]|nr:MAG: ATPase P [Chloroflexota bacterium]
MISVSVPGFKDLQLEYLVLDFNGTLAVDGYLINGVSDRLKELAAHLEVYVLTADTFGQARQEMDGIPCTVTILPPDRQDIGKRQFIRNLGPERCVCIGNGRNDRLMLREAALGIAVLQAEGASAQTILAADVVVATIHDALDLLCRPLRLTATLRS